MNYKNEQYRRVIKLIDERNIFSRDSGNGVFRKKHYTFILENEKNNLYSSIISDCYDYFKENSIGWWSGEKCTNHPLSSQVACLNHLFLIRDDRQAVLDIIKQFDPNVVDVLKIESDKFKPAYIQFEAISDSDHLNEKSLSRGSNCTSIDALVYGVHADGTKIMFPIEWKYVESYSNDDKSKGDKGDERKRRYSELINSSNQLRKHNTSIYYYEPFYQLMRQTLWAEQMIAHKDIETIKADSFIHIHVIPDENEQLLNKTYKCSGKNMELTWRDCINDNKKYIIVSPEKLLMPIDKIKYHNLLEYLKKRYWEKEK